MSYNKAKASEDFEEGKRQLERSHYEQAIEIFTGLIDLTAPHKDSDADAKLTWDTALNNRGVSRCNKGYSEGNKELFDSGLKDFRTTVNTFEDDRKPELMASASLRIWGPKEADFTTMQKVQIRKWDL